MADRAKRCDKGTSSTIESEEEDTATSHTHEGVVLSDVEALKYIITFHSCYTVFPWDNPTSCYIFVSPSIHLGLGNAIEWDLKFEHLRNKWLNQCSRSLNESDKKEYSLWQKIWGWDGSSASS